MGDALTARESEIGDAFLGGESAHRIARRLRLPVVEVENVLRRVLEVHRG